MIEENGRLWMLVSKELALYGTLEVRVLFDQWVNRIEQAVLEFIRENDTTAPQEIAERLSISPDSALFFLDRLAKGKKLKSKRD